MPGMLEPIGRHTRRSGRRPCGADGQIRNDGFVAELTGLLDLIG